MLSPRFLADSPPAPCAWRAVRTVAVYDAPSGRQLSLALHTRFNPFTGKQEVAIGLWFLFEGLTVDEAMGQAMTMLGHHFTVLGPVERAAA